VSRRGAVLVVGLALLVLGPCPPARAEHRLTHVHASQRYDRPLALLRREIRRDARPGVDLVTMTEVQGRARSAPLHARPGWAAYTDTRMDTGVMWPRARWRLVARRVFLADPRPYPTETGTRRTWGMGVVLDPRPPYAGPRVLVTVAHMPSHVEYGDAWRPGMARRVSAYRRALRGWETRLNALRDRWHPGAVLTVADWNVNLRRPHWRALIRRAFPGQRITWSPPYPKRGTHAAGRLIDATLTTERGRAHLLRHSAASDHTPYIERLTLDGPPLKGVASAP
jgi:hypothetical protein